jgi:hypothetical protein
MEDGTEAYYVEEEEEQGQCLTTIK